MSKRNALLFFLSLAVAGCSASPGSQETGYGGIPWGANADTVARKLDVPFKVANADALFGSAEHVLAPESGLLLNRGFAKLVSGRSGAPLNATGVLQGMTILNEGEAGYSLFFNGKFGMNLHAIPVNAYQGYHDKLMKRYGVIDKKLEYRANEHESSYLIMWHDADGVIILAKEISMPHPPHRSISTQVIHMDKRIFDAISGGLSKAG